jgi:uncharacterized damage-inducible protein DinB
MELVSLLEMYEAGPEELRQAVAGVEGEEWTQVPVEGMWSIHEVVCHLADFEIIGAERMKRVLAEDNPTLLDADPDQFSSQLAYSQRDVETELAVIETTRRHMAAILKACDLEDMQRTGVHSADGPLTLETLLERVTQHIPHHIQFISQKRAVMAESA